MKGLNQVGKIEEQENQILCRQSPKYFPNKSQSTQFRLFKPVKSSKGSLFLSDRQTNRHLEFTTLYPSIVGLYTLYPSIFGL